MSSPFILREFSSGLLVQNIFWHMYVCMFLRFLTLLTSRLQFFLICLHLKKEHYLIEFCKSYIFVFILCLPLHLIKIKAAGIDLLVFLCRMWTVICQFYREAFISLQSLLWVYFQNLRNWIILPKAVLFKVGSLKVCELQHLQFSSHPSCLGKSGSWNLDIFRWWRNTALRTRNMCWRKPKN